MGLRRVIEKAKLFQKRKKIADNAFLDAHSHHFRQHDSILEIVFKNISIDFSVNRALTACLNESCPEISGRKAGRVGNCHQVANVREPRVRRNAVINQRDFGFHSSSCSSAFWDRYLIVSCLGIVLLCIKMHVNTYFAILFTGAGRSRSITKNDISSSSRSSSSSAITIAVANAHVVPGITRTSTRRGRLG